MTTTVLRPNGSTVVAGSATPTGGASAHAVTSDDSDASYATLNGASVEFDMASVTLAAGAVTKSATLRFRRSHSDLFYRSIHIDGSPGSGVLSKAVDPGTSPATFTASTLPVTLTQAQIDGLYVEFLTFESDTRLHEVYVDLVTVAQPVVAVFVVSPDPYTDSTQVPISWSNTLDSDGGAQTHYQVIATDDDDSDAIVFDSGVVVGGATSATVGPLPNGNYTVSVRVAQTVNGARHWSDYDTDSFEVDVDTADISSTVGVPDSAAGKVAVIVGRDAGTRVWEFVEVERSIDGGATWTPVRTATFADASGDTDAFSVDDYEVANRQSVEYRARATWYSSGLPVTSAWVGSPTVFWSSDDEWLKAPLAPSLNVKIEGVAFASQGRTASAGRFKVIGRPDRVVVSDSLSAASGSITVRTEGKTEALAIDDLLENAGTLLLNLSTDSLIGPKRDGFMWISVVDVSEEWETLYYRRSDADRRLFTIAFDEARQPADATASAS